jgi:CCR4-NOT transcription complex subunit 6
MGSTGSLAGTNGSTSTMGGHYAKQLEASQRARIANSPHHHARVAASQMRMSNLTNNNIQNSQISIATAEQLMIPKLAPKAEASSWTCLDMGGMMINHINNGLFSYKFLTALYLNHNNLTSLPIAISQLEHLTVLNLTGNQLTSLPAELGLVVSLKELLLFDNQLTFIPPEFGQLYQLELLGLEGNPMSEPLGSMINEKGTPAVIKYLRDSCPCILLLTRPTTAN